MPSLPNLHDYVSLIAGKKFIATRDLSDFFRQIPMNVLDSDYLCYSVFNLLFRDRSQPYGVSSAPANAQYFASILLWIFDNKLLKVLRAHCVNKSNVFIDDFSFVGFSKEDVDFMIALFDQFLKELNVHISHKKSVNTTQKIIVHGLKFNLINQTVSIPPQKFSDLKELINATIKHRIISGKALDSLCGRIMHWSQLFKPLKIMCYNMISYIHDNFRNNTYNKNHFYVLPISVLLDLKYWLKFSEYAKSVTMDSILNAPSFTLCASTDASSNGGGYIFEQNWSMYKFSIQHQNNWFIAQKEAHVILSFIETFKFQLTGKSILICLDNEVFYYAMCHKWSPKRSIMIFVYEVCLLMIKYKIQIHFRWIESAVNSFADALSRFKLNDFHQLIKLYRIKIANNMTKTNYFNEFTLAHSKQINYQNDMIEYKQFINFLKIDYETRKQFEYITQL